MLFADHLILIRGGGDLATGVVARLHRAGFPVIVLELAYPLVVRRTVAVAVAVAARVVQIDDPTRGARRRLRRQSRRPERARSRSWWQRSCPCWTRARRW